MLWVILCHEFWGCCGVESVVGPNTYSVNIIRHQNGVQIIVTVPIDSIVALFDGCRLVVEHLVGSHLNT